MDLIHIILASLFIFLVLTYFSQSSDKFSPARLLSIIWVIVLFLAQLKLSYYQFEWGLYSWFVILISIISFLMGCYVVYSMNFRKSVLTINQMRILLNRVDALNENKFFFWTNILFLAYIISYLVIWAIVGYIPAFTAHPNFTRVGWGIFGFGLFIHLTPIILYFVVVFWIKFKTLSKRIILFLIGLITFGSFFLLYQRFSLVIGIILSLVYIYYGTTKFNFKNFLLFAIPLALIIFGLSTLRESELFIYYLHYISNMKTSLKYAAITEPYMYLVMSAENFAFAVEKLENHTYGLYTFDFITALSGLKHSLKEYLYISDFPHLLSPFYNTYTTFFIFYRDFGLLGSFVFPFLIGFVSSHLYYRMRINPNFHTISVYGMLVIIIVFSFFIPLITWLYFVFDFTVVYIVTKLIMENSNNKVANEI